MNGEANNLTTVFRFDDKDGAKVDALRNKLLSANNDFNNLGGNIAFGKTFADNSTLAGKSVDTLKTKVDGLKTTTESQIFKPTISRHWENEAAEVSKSVNKIKIEADKAKNTVYTPSKPLGSIPDAPKPTFAEKYDPAFSNIESRLGKSQGELQKIIQNKSGNGQFDVIYQGAFAAEKKVNDLTNRVRALKKEAADPANAKFGKYYAEGIREAELELSRLERKQQSLKQKSGGDLRLSSFQKTNLGYQVNDIATMAAMGASPAQILASQGGQIAQIFEPAQIKAFAAQYAALLPILGLGSAALLLTYKITGDIRDRAEQRLKTEEKITATLNKQRLAAQELTNEFNKNRKDDAEARRIQNYQQDNPIEVIRGRRELINNLLSLKANDVTELGQQERTKLQNEFIQLDNQLKDFDRNRELADRAAKEAPLRSGVSFDQRKLDFRRNQQAELDAIANRFQLAIRYAGTLKSETQKIAELQKTYSQIVGSNLSNDAKFGFYQQVSEQIKQSVEKIKELKSEFRDFLGANILPDNPFVKILLEIDTAGERAQKRFGALGDEFVKAAEKAERANLTKKLGLQQFQSQSEGLRFNQEARRAAALPETQFASFQRAIELVSKSVDFIAGSGSLNRQIQESRFYADTYNPNNPKSFAEFNRRGMNDDISDFGVQVRAAVEDIKNLNAIGLQGTGVYGRGAIADRILSLIPSREELLRRLENPATRDEAQFLLNQQSGALTSKRDFEQRKFNDFVESQKNLEFNKQFAREQIALLDRQTGLDSAERARQLLNIVNPLGDDVDVNLQRRKFQANLEAGAAKINEQKEALEAWKAAAKSTAEINEKLNQIISEKGVKVDSQGKEDKSVVEIVDKSNGAARVLGATPKPEDMLSSAFGFDE